MSTPRETQEPPGRFIGEVAMITRRWDFQWTRNPWFSLGIHIDHRDPSITLHLPGLIIYAGRCKQPGFRKEKS